MFGTRGRGRAAGKRPYVPGESSSSDDEAMPTAAKKPSAGPTGLSLPVAGPNDPVPLPERLGRVKVRLARARAPRSTTTP